MSVLDGVNLGLRRRLPMILQTEASECGLACLAMIAGYVGKPLDLAELRRRFGLSLKGATLKDLIRIGDGIGLASRPLRIELHELTHLKTPCILHWNLNHFVVLKSAGRSSIVIHDPGVGARRLSMEQVSKQFTGVALELTPIGGFQESKPPPRVRVMALLGHLRGVKRSLAQLFGLALAIEVFAITSPLLMAFVIDQALVTADRSLLQTLMLGFAMLLILRTTVAGMRGWMLMMISATLGVQAQTNLFSHLVRLPGSYYESRYMGDVMSRFESQQKILAAITTDLVEAILDGLMASITLVVMFMFAPPLAAIVLAGAALYGVLRWTLYGPLRLASAEAIVWGARQDSHFLETLRGIKTIKLFNGQEGRRAHWLNLLVETTNRGLTVSKLRLLFRIANRLLVGGVAILVIWLGADRVLENTFTVGMLIAFISYKDQFLSRVSELINRAVDLKMLRVHAERLADIALTAPEPSGPAIRLVRDQPPASIEVRNLRFRYSENDPWVLDGLNVRFQAGEAVAIVGPSGCGKSTLLKILASLLQPTAGEILVNGTPLVRLGIDNFRAMLGVVMQDDQLFAGSIADNISFFSERPDAERIEHCARLAAVHDDILAMPMAYSTLIGDMGTVLSGGQKQRVLIARALYNKPSVLLFDEATSHLDVNREKAVNAALRSTAVTRISAAHRPETIRSADRVIVLDRGQILDDIDVASVVAASAGRRGAQVQAAE
ncbi:MAG: peptidase domain-containing ABC transporter [Rhodospirillales bacterium]|nr:peptidase domain-containing ABC transporter [Rhodospirillales bacterium]